MVTQAAESEMDLEQYTVAELKDIAAEEGIDVPSDARKDEIIKAIEQGRQGKDAVVTPLALTGPVIPLPLSGIVADVYGIGRKYNIQLADLQALGAIPQANFLLDNLSPGSIVQYVRTKHSQAVAGTGITACTAQVGDGTNLWGAALDVFAAPSNAALNTAQLSANNVGPFAAVYPVYLTLIATGGNLGVATAGAISAWLRWTPIA